MSELTIWFDESGFTGEDLMNPDQRHFTLASTIIPDDEAEALLQACFPNYGGSEFKFSAVWRRPSHRQGLLRFAERLSGLFDRVFAYNIDKRFSLLIKFIDYLVEPLIYANGYDFYKDGYSRRYVNMVNADLLAIDGGRLHGDIIARWNRFARNPTREELATLKEFVIRQRDTIEGPLSNFFLTVDRGIDFLTVGDERLENFQSTNEIQVTGMFQSVAYWRAKRDEDFCIVHDESTAFFKQRDMWRTMLRDDLDPLEMISAAGTSTIFPLRVRATVGERSERSASIQLCDLVAGVFTRALRMFGGEADPFIFELMRAGFGEMPMSGVMPEPERVSELPPRREGPDAVDQMVEVLRPHLERIQGKAPSGDLLPDTPQ